MPASLSLSLFLVSSSSTTERLDLRRILLHAQQPSHANVHAGRRGVAFGRAARLLSDGSSDTTDDERADAAFPGARSGMHAVATHPSRRANRMAMARQDVWQLLLRGAGQNFQFDAEWKTARGVDERLLRRVGVAELIERARTGLSSPWLDADEIGLRFEVKHNTNQATRAARGVTLRVARSADFE